MKKLMCFALAVVLTAMVMNSCKDDDPVKPDDNGTSLQLVSCDSYIVGSVDSATIDAYATIKNVSSTSKSVMIKMETVTKTNGHLIQFCDWGSCMFPNANGEIISQNAKTLAAGESIPHSEFHLSIAPNGNSGTTKLKFTAYVKDDPDDKLVFYITFQVGI